MDKDQFRGHTDPTQDTILFGGSGSKSHIDDAVIDEILRSISDQSDPPAAYTPVQPAAQRPAQEGYSAPVQPQQTAARQGGFQPPYSGENSYQQAARAHQQETDATRPVSPVAGARPVSGQSTTGPIPDPHYYAHRDPAQTQSFQPARPTHRNTDRLPTLMEEKPVHRKSPVGKILTMLVVILVVVALVLGIRMAYILAPSMGWNLPDVTQMPVISDILALLPQEEDTQESAGDIQLTDESESETVDNGPRPTAITLDQTEVTLDEGESVVLTATVDTQWTGTVFWGSSDEAIFTVQPVDGNSFMAQVTYVGEGRGNVVAMIPAETEDEEPIYVSCSVVCNAPSQEEEVVEEPQETDTEEETEGTDSSAHVDIALNREDFTLNVGEGHKLMSENADQVTWTTSDESVATVDDNGNVRAVAAGTATITATGPDGASASAICRVR